MPALTDRWPSLLPPVVDQMTYGEVLRYLRHAADYPPPARTLYTTEG